MALGQGTKEQKKMNWDLEYHHFCKIASILIYVMYICIGIQASLFFELLVVITWKTMMYTLGAKRQNNVV